MKPSLIHKLTSIADRFAEVGALLIDPEVMNNQNRFRELSKEYAQLEPIVKCFQAYQENNNAINSAKAMFEENDLELRKLAEEELVQLKIKTTELEDQLQNLLLPKDPNDDRNVYLEIRAGTGGDEAAIFAGDMFRMYARYAERKGWKATIVSCSEGEHGGFKEIITRISGDKVYSQLKFESGVHRVQRVPKTEAQGRIHTSAITIAIMPEIDEVDHVVINPAELRIDTYRASGAGGQHVNRTDSAVRITHLPTGIVVECQDERSQHKNKARAMSLLQTRILNAEREKQDREQAEKRRLMVGTGDRSERIRTYNFPQGRVTDHRINVTLYQLDKIIEGDLDPLIGPLIRELQAEQIAALSED
jgi:peptide chain release factor 1